MRKSGLLPNAVLLSGSKFLSIFTSLFTAILIARELGPEGRGAYGIILSSCIILPTFFNFGLNIGGTYFISRKELPLTRLFRTNLAFSLIAYTISSVVLSISYLGVPLQLLPKNTTELAFIAILVLLFSSFLQTFLHQLIIGFEDFTVATYISVISQIIFLVLLVTRKILFGGFSIEYVLFALIVQHILLQGGFIFRLRLHWPAEKERSFLRWFEIKHLFSYSYRCFLGNIVQMLNYRLDLYIVNYFHNLGETGIYSVAVSVAQILWVFPGAVAGVIFPRTGSQGTDKANLDNIAIASRLIVLLTVISTILSILIFYFVLIPLFGEKYNTSFKPFICLLIGIIVFAPSQIWTSFLAGIGKPEKNLYGALAGLTVTISLDFLLIPRWGGVGAAIATSCSYFLTTGFAFVFIVRETGIDAKNLISFPSRNDIIYLLKRFRIS